MTEVARSGKKNPAGLSSPQSITLGLFLLAYLKVDLMFAIQVSRQYGDCTRHRPRRGTTCAYPAGVGCGQRADFWWVECLVGR